VIDQLIRKRYLRPLYVSIALAAIGELAILLVWGVWLFPEGSLWGKFAWIAVCSIGMGSVVGALVDLAIVDRLQDRAAMGATLGLTVLVIGVGCNYLCWSLDHYYTWWGGVADPALFLGGGFVGSLVLGWLGAYLLFSRRGPVLLERFGF